MVSSRRPRCASGDPRRVIRVPGQASRQASRLHLVRRIRGVCDSFVSVDEGRADPQGMLLPASISVDLSTPVIPAKAGIQWTAGRAFFPVVLLKRD